MTSLTIPSEMPEETAQNFQRLRDETLTLVSRLSGDQWSDHNLHDPGITMMEAACFAITDLGYRLDFPMGDLLTQPETEAPQQPFWSAPQALACQPLTENDYRRSILDIPGVRNVSLGLDEDNPALWTVQVIPDSDAPEDLDRQVREHFLQRRNLGEDLGTLTVLEEAPLTLRLNLTLADGADTVETLAGLLVSVAEYISPVVSFDSYEDLLHQGFRKDELSTGPWLDSGYITDASLNQPVLAPRLYLTQLVTRVSKQPGVEFVARLQLTDKVEATKDDWESWILLMPELQAPVLDLARSLNNIEVMKEGIAVSVPAERVTERFYELLSKVATPGRTYVQTEPGRYRSLNHYVSLQHELPAMYGVGRDGLAPGAAPEQVSSVRQLQAYLLLFDQVLANQFAQLDTVRHQLGLPEPERIQPLLMLLEKMQSSLPLTSAETSLFWRTLYDLPASHHSQPVTGLQQLPEILAGHQQDYQSGSFQHLTEAPFSVRQLDRITRVLEHQLARFHEQVPDRAMLKYEEVFRHYSERLLTHPDADKGLSPSELTVRLAQLKSLLDRAAFLLDIPVTGGHRGQGGNYLEASVRGNQNISGLRHRIYRRLGLPRVAMNSLATHNGEGFHLVEAVLLRQGQRDQQPPVAALSHEIFIVAPVWPSRMADPDFAQLFIDTLHREMPMHLQPRVLWLTRDAMADFEKVHNAWLNAMSTQRFHNDEYDEYRLDRIRTISWYLDDFIQQSLQGSPPDVSEWPVSLPTLGEREEGEVFTVGYETVPELSYDPATNTDGVISKVRIRPEGGDTANPFIVRIRTPYPVHEFNGDDRFSDP